MGRKIHRVYMMHSGQGTVTLRSTFHFLWASHWQSAAARAAIVGCAAPLPAKDKSDCHFRITATEYDRKPCINWLSCTAK